MGGGPGGHPRGCGQGAAPPPLLPTGSREQCPASGWHTQTWGHLALPGPSLAEDLKTVCGNPSRPPGLSASMLRILQGQNTETERLASLRRAGNSSAQPGPCPQGRRPLLLQGWGWKPSPAHSHRRCEQDGCKHISSTPGKDAGGGRGCGGRDCTAETEVHRGPKQAQSL